MAVRHHLKHGVGHRAHHRRTLTHHHLSAEARAHIAAALRGKKHKTVRHRHKKA